MKPITSYEVIVMNPNNLVDLPAHILYVPKCACEYIIHDKNN